MADKNKKPKHPFESFISKLPFSDCDERNQPNPKPAITKQVKKVILINFNFLISQNTAVNML